MAKKLLFVTLIVVLLLMNFSAAMAKADGPGKALSVLEVRNDHTGVKILFAVEGVFAKSELNLMAKLPDGSELPVYCAQKGTTVVCESTPKLGGKNVSFYFGGQFWQLFVPVQKSAICYEVFDFSYETEDWSDVGSICTLSHPQNEDWWPFYSPEWGEVYPFEFYEGAFYSVLGL